MWVIRCRVLANKCFGHVRNIKNFGRDGNASTTSDLSICRNHNHLSCQQPRNSVQTGIRNCTSSPSQVELQFRNAWTGGLFHPNLIRAMSKNYKGSDDRQVKNLCKEKKTSPTSSGGVSSGEVSGGGVSSGGVGLIFHDRQVRQNFHQKCVDNINAQINEELCAAYTYAAMASFCYQDNVALDGFAKFFTNSYKEEIEHAQMFMDYLNKRGGQLRLAAIPAPAKHEWKQAEDLVVDALTMEKCINEKLLQMHACATKHEDPHLSDFLEEHYLPEQVDAIKALADLLTTVKRAQRDLGVHVLNRQMHDGMFSPHGNGK